MTVRRLSRFAAVLAATFLWSACGDIYRPVVIPTTLTPPNPSNFHAVFGLDTNIPGKPGAAVQIDVSGDEVVAQTPTDPNGKNIGIAPTHFAALPNNSRLFVASAGSMFSGGTDMIAAFTPSPDTPATTGFGAVFAFDYPNITIDPTTNQQYFCSYLPDFVGTSQSTVVYVANFGVDGSPNCNLASTDSVTAVNAITNTISSFTYLAAGSHPVALAETPDGHKLYVANQGNSTVSSLNTVDMSANPVTGFSGNTPVWVVARSDSHRVYVLTQGDGQLITMDTSTDSQVGSLAVGAGANFAAYDSRLNRLYVANPANDTVYVISTSGGANDTPVLVKTITIPGLISCATCSAAIPTHVAPMRDGSRFYVAGYQTASACPDPNVVDSLGNPLPCVIPELTVIDTQSLNVRTGLFLLASPMFSPTSSTNPQPYAVPEVAACAPPATYAPGTTRFRMTTAAAADSSRVYVGMCDAGAIAVVNTTTSTIVTGGTNTPDTLVNDLLAPFSAATAGANGEPPPQNPIFMATGQ